MVRGSLLAARLEARFGIRTAITTAIAMAGIASAVIAGSSDLLVVAAMMAAVSFGGGLWNVTTTALRQRAVPSHLLGRVQSVHRLICWGTLPASALVGGVIANEWGVRAPFVAAALAMVVVVVAAQRLFRAGSGLLAPSR
jgi:MFS family permease